MTDNFIRGVLVIGLAWAATFPARSDEPKPDPERVRQRVKQLVTELEAASVLQRENAVAALWQLGPLAKDAAPALVKALKDSSPRVRPNAAAALLRIDQAQSKEALPVLIAGLKDAKTPFVEGVFLCSRLQPVHKDLIAGLLDMVRDDHPLVFVVGSNALENVGPDAKDAAPLLEDALKDRKPEVRLSSAAGLLRIGPDWNKKVQPVAEELLKESDFDVRVRAARVLTAVDGSLAPKAVEALLGALESKKIDDRLTVAAVVVELAPDKAAVVVEALAEGLKGDDAEKRRRCAEKIGSLGRYGEPAEKALRALLDDKDAGLATAAAEALIRVLPQKAGDLLIPLARSRDKRDRSNTAGTLELINMLVKIVDETIAKEKDADAKKRLEKDRIKGLIEQVGKPRGEVNGDLFQVHAAMKLGQLGPAAKEAVPHLVNAMDEFGGPLRQQVVVALGKIGPEARAAVPALLAVYRDRRDASLGLRREAAEAIKLIDPETAKKEGVR
jgi:HEAT repeat protein